MFWFFQLFITIHSFEARKAQKRRDEHWWKEEDNVDRISVCTYPYLRNMCTANTDKI